MKKLKEISYLHSLSKERGVPNVSIENGTFLYFLVRSIKPSKILEVGTANGISTLFFASALRENNKGVITTIEPQIRDFNEAKQNIENLGFADITNQMNAKLQDIYSSLDGGYDFIFIDAYKRDYLEYFLIVEKIANFDAIFVFDDVVKFKHKMENFYNFLEENTDKYEWTIVNTDEDDGIMILHKIK